MDIQAKSLKALEWDKLTFHLSAQCETAAGRNESCDLPLPTDVNVVRQLLDETAEAAALVENNSAPSLSKVPSVEEILARLQAQACLDSSELLQIKILLNISKGTRGSLTLLPAASYPQLTRYISEIHSLEDISHAIAFAIEENGEIKDDASEELAKLRRELRQLDQRIKSELAKIIHSPDLTKVLQEPIFTQRDNRFVVPVIASARESLPGIVHDSSASGLTVYVEPTRIVELSNNVRLKEREIDKEITRILEDLSNNIRPHVEEIRCTYRTLVQLDKIFARARLGIKYNGTIPSVMDWQKMQLSDARHPLLVLQNKSSVVGNNIKLTIQKQNSSAEQIHTLVITGPNTGGKTVYLKTIGLLAIMLRAGLMLSVQKGSSACVFENILADIGDEQSLEQSLSTFSSHLTNISEIVHIANRDSLVLLDEIGAGTDPKEGAALAQAILEKLNEQGATSIATTHLVELKTLAYTKDGFMNGSFEFDESTLAPTFRFHLGIPGSSQAANIAQRLGLNPEVIERARSLLQSNTDTAQETMLALEKRVAGILTREENIVLREQQTNELLADLETKAKALQTDREKVRREYAQQLETELATAKQLINELTAELQRDPGLAKAQAAKDQLQSLQSDVPWLQKGESNNTTGQQSSYTVGQKVFVRSLGQWGIIEKLPKNYDAQSDPLTQIRIGNKRITVRLTQLRH